MSIQTITNTLVQVIILALPTYINGETIWMDWCTLFSYAIGFLIMIGFKVEYDRMQLDTATTAADSSPSSGERMSINSGLTTFTRPGQGAPLKLVAAGCDGWGYY